MTQRLLVLSLLALVITAAPAAAATVETRIVEVPNTYTAGTSPEWRVLVRAAPGERNDIRLRSPDDFTVRVHDAGAALAAGERCRQLDPRTVECSIPERTPSQPGLSPYLYTADVEGGDGNDIVRVEAEGLPRLVGDGGPGDDELIGSDAGGDVLDGGGGNDHLAGRGNGDVLTDGDTSRTADADILDGGTENDTIDYSSRTDDLVVDLADGRDDGEAGENDQLVDLEHVTSGSGDDDLGGGPGPTVLNGGAGNDHLDGEGAGDSLHGEAGHDRLHGQAGNDSLHGGSGRDRLRGDRGSDHVFSPASIDRVGCGRDGDTLDNARNVLVRWDCERLRFRFDGTTGELAEDEGAALEARPHPVLSSTGRTLRFTLSCTRAPDSDGTCAASRGMLRVHSAGGAPLGSVRFAREFAERGDERLVMRLGTAARRLVAEGRPLRISLSGSSVPTARWHARTRRR